MSVVPKQPSPAREAATRHAHGIIAQLAAEYARQKKADGLSLYAVAKLAGCDQIGTTRVLKGEEMPNLARACGIAAALGFTLTLAPAPAMATRAKKARPG
jgi:transcriptional regulator with XRE-family HTH domain